MRIRELRIPRRQDDPAVKRQFEAARHRKTIDRGDGRLPQSRESLHQRRGDADFVRREHAGRQFGEIRADRKGTLTSPRKDDDADAIVGPRGPQSRGQVPAQFAAERVVLHRAVHGERRDAALQFRAQAVSFQTRDVHPLISLMHRPHNVAGPLLLL